eukprot:1932780-Prymnesium_polylepis.1
MPFFKTKICRNWETNGACRLGAQCGFAHGRAELRQIDAAALDAFSRPAPAAAPPKSAADKVRARFATCGSLLSVVAALTRFRAALMPLSRRSRRGRSDRCVRARRTRGTTAPLRCSTRGRSGSMQPRRRCARLSFEACGRKMAGSRCRSGGRGAGNWRERSARGSVPRDVTLDDGAGARVGSPKRPKIGCCGGECARAQRAAGTSRN